MEMYILLLVLLFVGKGGMGMKIITQDKVKSCTADNATLECKVHVHHQNFSISRMSWVDKTGKTLCSHPKQQHLEHGRIRCEHTHSSLVLKMHSVDERDQGLYTCRVFLNTGHHKSNTTLHVSVCPVVRNEAATGEKDRAKALESKWTLVVLLLTALLLTL